MANDFFSSLSRCSTGVKVIRVHIAIAIMSKADKIRTPTSATALAVLKGAIAKVTGCGVTSSFTYNSKTKGTAQNSSMLYMDLFWITKKGA